MERLITEPFSKDAVSHVNEMAEQEFDTLAHHFSDAFESKLLRHIHKLIAAYRVINMVLRYNKAIKLFTNGAAAVRMFNTKT
jgi:hypothetical protein